MARKTVTFTAPAAGWVQVSPVLPPTGGTNVTALPDSTTVTVEAAGSATLSLEDEGWTSWLATGAVTGGSVQTSTDITPTGIAALLAASAAKASAVPGGGGGSGTPGPAGPPGREGPRGPAGPQNLVVLESGQQVPRDLAANTVIVRKGA